MTCNSVTLPRIQINSGAELRIQISGTAASAGTLTNTATAAPPAGFTDTALLHPRQALFVATAGQHASLQALADALRVAGTPFTLLDAQALLRAAPALRPALAHPSSWR